MIKGEKRVSLLEYFIRRLHIPDDKNQCWMWLGLKDKDGYGKFGDMRAHRYAYQVFRGDIGRGLLVCHKCDHPPCVNPSHLWLGTNAENTADRNTKGRQAKQARIRGSVSVDLAHMIHQRLLAGEKRDLLAKEFSISNAQVHLIHHRKTWHFRAGAENNRPQQCGPIQPL